MTNEQTKQDELDEFFDSKPIFVYTRANAIDDGVLVEISNEQGHPELAALLKEVGFKLNTCMTAAAYHETVACGEADRAFGQSEVGRLWDVLMLIRHGMSRPEVVDRVDFKVSVFRGDTQQHEVVDMYALCHGGDAGEPCVTVMLAHED